MEQLKYRENLNKAFKLYNENVTYEKLKVFSNSVIVEFNLKKINITYMNEKIVKVFIGELHEEEVTTNAVIMDLNTKVDLSVDEQKDEIIVKNSKIITIINKKTSEIKFKDSFGNIVCEDYQPSFKDQDGHVYISKVNDCYAYYGLGEKGGSLNKKGCYTENYNTDDPDTDDNSIVYYKTVPFYVGLKESNVYGIFFDNSYRSFYDMGKNYEDRIYFGAIGGQINYYFILGDSIKEVVSEYTNLTGKMDMPPLWSLGYQQNRFSYLSKEEVKGIINTFEKKSIPIDVLYLDIDYMDGFRVMTFKDPEFSGIENLIGEFKEKGIRTITILDPGVKVDEEYPVYTSGLKEDIYVKKSDGSIFLGSVWAGESVFPDFSNYKCRKWWKNLLKEFINKYNISGIWNDMNEPCVFDNEYKTIEESCLHNSDYGVIEHKEFHNRYGFEMSRCSKEAQEELNSNLRGFSMTRATYAGGQRYSSIWTGDNSSLWSQLRMSISMDANLGISGFSFVGNDVGGFGLDCTEELFIRWMQLGTFLPIFRNHSNMYTRRQEPWAFGLNAEKIAKEAIELRYELLPYIYTCFYESYKYGLPVFRPLVMEFEKDRDVLNIKEQFMFGSNILVCPVLHEGERHKFVYFPEGKWYNYKTNEIYEGNSRQKIKCDLSEILFFVKEGSIIPVYEEKYKNVDNKPETVTIKIYGNKAEGLYYYDDGISNEYKEGKYNLVKITSENRNVNFEFLNKGYKEENRKYVFID